MREQAPPPAMPAPTPDEPAPEVKDTTTTEMTMTETAPPATTAEQTGEVGLGTSSSYGAGAVGGPAITHGLSERRSQGQVQAREGATVRRRSTTSTTVDPNTLGPTIEPQTDTTNDTVVPPSEQEPGTSDTSTQGTRTNPDSQEQGIGAGDTYDRNR